jgi:probable HAF family extracellular repeat protein
MATYTYSYTALNDPFGVFGTVAQGINDSGQIVGWYETGYFPGTNSGVDYGFLYSGGSYTVLNEPLSPISQTFAYGINDAGQIVGSYTTYGSNHGFLYSGGVYTPIDDPLVTSSIAVAINDTGQIIGDYTDSKNIGHGYLYSGGTYTTIDVPNAGGTAVNGINNAGQIVGNYADSTGVGHGFLYSNGTYTTIDDPLGVSSVATGINNAGQIVGYYLDSGGYHGFLYSGGTYTTLDFPSSVKTVAYSINDADQIVGFYNDGSGGPDAVHGFVANVDPTMLDAVSSTLSGTAEPNSKLSIFDGTKLIGTTTAAADGTWNLQTKVSSTVHSYSETSVDAFGNIASSTGVTVYSPSSNKSLVGGSGNDFLIAGQNDTLTGGAGNDTFVFNANFGKDVINDFDVNHENLAFSHKLFANDAVAQILSQTHDSSAGAVIVVDAHDSITLHNVTTAQLAAHPSDFHFF